MENKKQPRDDEGRVSLAPLDPEEALRALLAVHPADDEDEAGPQSSKES